MYIGLGTVVLILAVVIIFMMMRDAGLSHHSGQDRKR